MKSVLLYSVRPLLRVRTMCFMQLQQWTSVNWSKGSLNLIGRLPLSFLINELAIKHYVCTYFATISLFMTTLTCTSVSGRGYC